ncbi:DUF1104 domain-containing protein [Helicobacter marmotae]|uniref:DUF1104 domain-containing protein n=1 Tax=Helicobacter marmotae TaxID=152490 RepID=A0A3D8I6H5_9HELI|nr:DUF1104 domain-containing protein [Helicobacter marmotae]RDU60752.1 DUF1104 domain-containing protein [Helicobacter marmotae]
MKRFQLCVVATALSAFLCSAIFAADFSKTSEADLIKLSGVVKVEDFADYQIEIAKRLKKKSEKDAQAFKEKLKAQYEKATENLSVKQLREYKKSTQEAMKKRIESMSVKELQESGLPFHKHFDKAKGDGKSSCKERKLSKDSKK